jgi:tight adherence protein B
MLSLLFFVLLVVTFLVVLFVTRPTKKEIELKERLAGFDSGSTEGEEVGTDILKRDVYSESPLLDAILRRLKLASDISALIKQADSRWTVGGVFLGAFVLFICFGLVGWRLLHGASLGVLVGAAAAITPYLYLQRKRTSRRHRFAAVLPDAIDLLGRAIRAGHAVTAAIEMVSREVPDPVGTEFRRVFEEQNFGLPMREALLNLAARMPVADLQFLVTAMLVQKETGGNLAEVLDKAGLVIRERSRLLGQLRIYTAQGRMTGWILGLLPFLLFVAMNFLNPVYTHTMLDDPTGRMWIWAGLGLMTIGVWSIRRIVDIKV